MTERGLAPVAAASRDNHSSGVEYAMAGQGPLGLICAIPEEIAHFGQSVEETGTDRIAGLTFHHGRLDGHPVVMVEAGIGKVNAAVVATILLDRYGARGLIFSGVAGGLHTGLGVGDLVIATRLVQHDYGAVINGTIKPYQPGVPPLPGFDEAYGYDMPDDLKARVEAALDGVDLPRISSEATGESARDPQVHYGTVLTGDAFLNCSATRDRLRQAFGATAIEMEGGAVAQVAARFDRPVVVVRCLSDLAGEESHMDFGAFLGSAAETSARAVRRLLTVF